MSDNRKMLGVEVLYVGADVPVSYDCNDVDHDGSKMRLWGDVGIFKVINFSQVLMFDILWGEGNASS